MRMLHDPNYRAEIERRLRELTPGAARRWGKMSVGQMLWHVNEALSCALGIIAREPAQAKLPKPLMKFLVLNVPWMRGAPTLPQWVARDSHDFAVERARCLRLVEDLAARKLDGPAVEDPLLGRLTGTEVSRLHAKHLDHHLKQFGV
jgi:hypothetical protein